ncbi:MAG: hypothetical protein AABY53_06945, partial [Bdellovibrionota bacterium]
VNTRALINVPVSISYNPSTPLTPAELSTFVPVTLQAGSQTLTQSVSIANLVANGGSMTLPFNVTFQPIDVGLKTLIATVNAGQQFTESNFANNSTQLEVHVVNNKYKILKEVRIGQLLYNESALENPINIEPNNSNICSKNKIDPLALVNLKCVKTNALGFDEPVEDCVIKAQLSLNENAYPHEHRVPDPKTGIIPHDPSTRPKGTLTPNSSSQFLAIPLNGRNITYTASEFAGIYHIDFHAIDPEGQPIDVESIQFRTKIKENLIPLDSLQEFLNIVNVFKHPEDGYFATSVMISKLRDAFTSYFAALSLVPNILPSAITPINSEATSLSWGGRFDVAGNWTGSHNCHREGEEMDISLSNFNGAFGGKKRELLNESLIDDDIFYYPVSYESPNPTPTDPAVTHWHIRLRK